VKKHLQQKRRPSQVPASYYWWPITEDKIDQAARKIAAQINPEKIILFGSFAYGQPTPDSDVDLLVIVKGKINSRARAQQISEILYPRPFPADILVRTPDEVKESLLHGDCFMKEVFSKGKILYEIGIALN